jgi:hypothetical protein
MIDLKRLFSNDLLYSPKFFILLLPPIIVFFIWMTFVEKPVPEEVIEAEPPPPPPTQAELMMKALSEAYPDRIGPAQLRDDDWAFLIGETWFYYAEGRILPEELRDKVSEYGIQRFYNTYPAGLDFFSAPPPQPPLSMRNVTSLDGSPNESSPSDSRRRVVRLHRFYEALWGMSSRQEAAAQMREVNFLGRKVTVHNGIVNALNIVEQKIMADAATTPAIRQWIDNLGLVDAWNWRNVASSVNRSFHSYGIAIDLLPKNLGSQATYWQWTARNDPEWWAVPFSKRYQPPQEVILAFESAGFIWGGKWPFYDTMHFEYHPEVFIINGIPLARE